MQISPLHPEFGAEVREVDLASELSREEVKQIDLWANEYSLLLFRQQHMNDDAHLAFTEYFGVPEEEHTAYYGRGEIAYLGTVGNVDENGSKLGNQNRGVRSGRGNEMWHSDSSFREVPSLYSILCAYEVPDEGGDTEFISTRSAFDRLDQDTQSRLQGMVVVHDYIYSRTKVSEDAVNEGQRMYMYPVRQRLIRRNPVTRQQNLYIGSHARDIEGIETEEARTLLHELLQQASRGESIYRHQWQVGDVLLWDNRCLLHRGCGYDADRYRRYMRQTRVRGAGPTLAENV
ncbi:MAG: TauD/TfdA family dioxygenase [Pseudomonadota bacterium]